MKPYVKAVNKAAIFNGDSLSVLIYKSNFCKCMKHFCHTFHHVLPMSYDLYKYQ